MSGYQPLRRGVNVSEYVNRLNNLDNIPRTDPLEEPENLQADLSIFNNNDFIDWNGEAGNFDPSVPLNLDFDFDQKPAEVVKPASNGSNDTSAIDPNMDFGTFEFADFSTFPKPIADPSMQALPHSLTDPFPLPHNFNSPVDSSVSPVTSGFELSTGQKRKLDHSDPTNHQSLDEAARVAAEEDKRRRNTAASARFRVKKKQREQQLEKTAKEMTDRVQILESRIAQLETENTWLKGLITEKNGGKATTQDVTAMLKKHIEENSVVDRSRSNHTDGVGTKAEETKA